MKHIPTRKNNPQCWFFEVQITKMLATYETHYVGSNEPLTLRVGKNCYLNNIFKCFKYQNKLFQVILCHFWISWFLKGWVNATKIIKSYYSDWHYLGAEGFQKFTIFNIFLKRVYFTLFCLIILNMVYVFNNLKHIPTRKNNLRPQCWFVKCK